MSNPQSEVVKLAHKFPLPAELPAMMAKLEKSRGFALAEQNDREASIKKEAAGWIFNHADDYGMIRAVAIMPKPNGGRSVDAVIAAAGYGITETEGFLEGIFGEYLQPLRPGEIDIFVDEVASIFRVLDRALADDAGDAGLKSAMTRAANNPNKSVR